MTEGKLELFPHQKERLQERVILGDDMGLGKTITVLKQLRFLIDELLLQSNNNRELRRPEQCFPFAVLVVPKSSIDMWLVEYNRVFQGHIAHDRCYNYHAVSGPPLKGYFAIVTTPDLLKRQYRDFKHNLATLFFAMGRQWKFVAVDEAQFFLKRETQGFRAIHALTQRVPWPLGRIVLITATLIRDTWNDLRVLTDLLHIVKPPRLPVPVAHAAGLGGSGGSGCSGHDHVALTTADANGGERFSFNRWIWKHLCVCRSYEEVGIELPPCYEVDVMCPLTWLQTALFDFVCRRTQASWSSSSLDTTASGDAGGGRLFLLRQLEQAATLLRQELHARAQCHSPFAEPFTEERGGRYEFLRQTLATSSKYQKLIELLRHIWRTQPGAGVVIFSEFVKTLELLMDLLPLVVNFEMDAKEKVLGSSQHQQQQLVFMSDDEDEDGDGDKRAEQKKRKRPATVLTEELVESDQFVKWACAATDAPKIPIFHGGLSASQRQAMLHKFNNNELGPVLLVSADCGGVSLNLADRAQFEILLDPAYCPTEEEQRIKRIHRIRQTKPVTVFHLLGDRVDVCLRGYQLRRLRELVRLQPERWRGKLEATEAFLAQHEHQRYHELLDQLL